MRRTMWIVILGLWLANPATALGQDSLGIRRVALCDYWIGNGDVKMVGNLAYVLDGMALNIMNLSNPAAPVRIGRFTFFLDESTGGVYIDGNRAYVCYSYGGYVLDISDPTRPAPIGQWVGNHTAITAIHDTLAIAEYEDGYPCVLDIADPANVHQIATFPDVRGPADALGWVNGYLCLMGWRGGVLIYDMSDPRTPQRVAAGDTLDYWSRYGELWGNYALIPSDAGLRIIDLTNPLAPVLAAVCDTGGYDVTMVGNLAVMSASHGLNMWNLDDPYHPAFVGTMPFPPSTTAFLELSGSGNTVCVENWTGEKVVSVVDISNPATPAVVSQFGVLGSLERFTLDPTATYIADSQSGLRIVDISTPSQSHELANLYTVQSDGWSAAGYGGYTYLTVRYWGVKIVDTHDPAAPQIVNTVRPASLTNALRVLTRSDLLYLFDAGPVGGPSRLYTFRLSEPANPAPVDSIVLPLLSEWNTFGLDTAGEYLYIAEDQTLTVYDLAVPSHPQPRGSCALPVGGNFAVRDLATAGRYAYIAYKSGGLVIVDLADPDAPVIANVLTDFCWAVSAQDSVLAVDGLFDIRLLNLSDPVHPQVIGYYPTDEWLNDLQLAGANLYTTSISEFTVYHLDALGGTGTTHPERPIRFMLHEAYPNPFNATTTIRFDLPREAWVELTIFNSLGQRVTTLVDRVNPAGTYAVDWDGTNLTGAPVASGMYLCRFKAGDFTATKKMLLMK